MTEVTWKLGAVLDQHGLSVYRLAQQLEGEVSKPTLYAIARGDSKRVDRQTLAALLAGLEALTSQRFSVADLLEYQRAG